MTDQSPPPPVFSQPPQPAPSAPKKTSGLAIASLVLGILSFVFLGPLTSIPGLICGIVALSSIRKSGYRIGGRGIAIVGTVLSAVNLVVLVLVIGLFSTALFPALKTARAEARRAMAKTQLRQISLALSMYEQDHENQLPSSLADLDRYLMGNYKVFVVPGSGTPTPKNAQDVRAGQCDFLYFGQGLKADQIQNKRFTPIACTRPGVLESGGAIVLYADGHVEDLRQIPANLQKLLQQNPRSALPPPRR